MKYRLIILLLAMSMAAGQAQNYGTKFERPLGEVFQDVQKRFGIRLKYNVDTTGLRLPYADFRIRAYSVEETLKNICAPFDFVPWDQGNGLWKIKPFEYPRRQPEDGRKLLTYLSSLYTGKASWEARRDSLRQEVHDRLGIDRLLKRAADTAPRWGKVRKYDGYAVRNFSLATVDGHTVKGSVYEPLPGKGKKKQGQRPLIICPNGHFSDGRYNADLQKRYATLARMGAVCVSYDLWGWGESVRETGPEAHHTDTAHVMQALNGLRILDMMMQRKDIDPARIGVNGGSGGGTHTVLLSVLDNRFTAACPVVSVSSWFDGGCPCESGMPVQLSGGGTCNAELAACFAPRPMLLVSDGGDWTSTTPAVEYPFLRRIYGFYDAADNVGNVHLPDERHDFGVNKRMAVYRFFIRTFRLDAALLDESKVTVETPRQLQFNPEK